MTVRVPAPSQPSTNMPVPSQPSTAPSLTFEWRGQLAPWGDRSLAILVGGWLCGLVGVGAGWFGASGTADVPAQMSWVDLAVAGVVVSGVTNCLWLTAGRRAVGQRRAALVDIEPPQPTPLRPARLADVTTSFDFFQVPGQRMVHRPDCPLLAGKERQPATPAQGPPCGVCAP
jgi:hypothetical protein